MTDTSDPIAARAASLGPPAPAAGEGAPRLHDPVAAPIVVRA